MFTPFAFIKRQVSAAIATIQKVLIAGSFNSFRAVNYNNLLKTTSTTSIDTTFNMGSGSNNNIYASAIDGNGKILIGGNFTTYSGSTINSIARINTNGTLDTTFNVGGGINNIAYNILPVSQSKILVGGGFSLYSGSSAYNLIRINSNGTLDSTFAAAATSFVDNTVITFATQSDGKIIVGGAFNNTAYSSPYLAKLTPQQTPDTTFNPITGLNGSVYTFATQSDGKILIGGQFTSYSGSTTNYITRINTNGTRDTTFNIGAGFNNQVEVIRVQPDGKILVGGLFTQYSGSIAQNHITRLNSNGTKDTTFNFGAGFSNGTVYDMQLQSDGKIIAVGSFSGTYSGSAGALRAVRLNTSGSRDLTFNIGTTGFSGIQYGAQIQNDGKIIVVGASATYSGSAAAQRIRRINTDGTLDTTFNIGTAGLNNTTYRAKIQPDQKILVLGAFTSYSGSAINRIARINTNGTLDTTFNVGTGFDAATQINSALELDSSGSIYAGSQFTTYSGSTANYFVKINPSGSIATGSGQYNGFNNVVNSLLVDSTGSVYAGGAWSFGGPLSPNNYIVRLNADGTKDFSFQIGTGFSNTVYSLQVQPDDKIVVGGTFSSYSGSSNNYLVRLNSNGTKDTTFQIGTGFSNYVYKVFLQSDNKILVGGNFTSYSGSSNNYLVRLNSNGSVDTTFNIGTGVNGSAFPAGISQDQSGSIHHGNSAMTSYSGSSVTGYVKLTSSGSIDPTFLSTAASASSAPGAYTAGTSNTGVRTISIDSSNNAYLFGTFQNYLAAGTGKVTALDLTQGNVSIPPNFGTGFNGNVNLSTQDSSGNIWLAGFSTNYSGSSTTSSAVIKINPQGNLLASASSTYLPSVTSLTTQSDQKILVGTTTLGPGINNPLRYNSNGTQDTTFATSLTYQNSILSIKQQSTGDILMGGNFYSYYYSDPDWIFTTPYYLTRLNSIGIDIGLNVQTNGTVYNINVLPDDSFIVTGDFPSFFKFADNSTTSSAYIGKLDSTGSIDTSYNVGTGFNNIVYTSTLQSNQKIIAAGTFTSYSGSTINSIARINSNGTLDTTFNPGVGFNVFNSYNSKILVDQDSNIHVVGPFTTYSGSTVNGYVKLLPNGNIHPSYTGSFNSPIGVNSINFSPVSASTMELINV